MGISLFPAAILPAFNANQPQKCSSLEFLFSFPFFSSRECLLIQSQPGIQESAQQEAVGIWHLQQVLCLLKPLSANSQLAQYEETFCKKQCLIDRSPCMQSGENMMAVLSSGLQRIIILPWKERWRTVSTTRLHGVLWHIPTISFSLLCSNFSSRNFSQDSCWSKTKHGNR